MTETEALAIIRDVVTSLDPGQATALAGLTRESELDATGVDSLKTLEVVGLLEERLGVTFPDDKLASLHSVGCLVDLVRQYGRPAPGAS